MAQETSSKATANVILTVVRLSLQRCIIHNVVLSTVKQTDVWFWLASHSYSVYFFYEHKTFYLLHSVFPCYLPNTCPGAGL